MQSTPRESSENNFMALLNFIVDPAVIVDEKGHLLLINNALKETTGLSEKEVIGKEVKESEERYRELTESISDVFFAMDKDLRYTYWNKASEKLTGILAKDAVGKKLFEVFPAR